MAKNDKKSKRKQKKEPHGSGVPLMVIGTDKTPVEQPTKSAVSDYPHKVDSVREEDINYRKCQVRVISVHTGFAVESVTQTSHTGEVLVQFERMVLFAVATELRAFVQEYTDDRNAYRSPAQFDMTQMLGYADALEAGRTHCREVFAETNDEDYDINPASGIDELIDHLLDKTAFIRAEYSEMIDRGVISFDMLTTHFKPGTRVVFGDAPDLEGAMVSAVAYKSGWSGLFFNIEGQRYSSDGKHFGKIEQNYRIPQFAGTVKLTDLPVRAASDHDLTMLSKRGAVWQQRCHQPQYLNYTGRIARKMGWSTIYTTANGRCMIDAAMSAQMNHSYDRTDMNVDVALTELPDEYLFTAPAFVSGFSMSKKAWGEFSISGLSEINFRDDAYDLLVLDDEVKSEVRALVENSDDMFTDIISGKGGGAIFLLHGTPGLGKTLTAESVAEILHRPLYSISVGELGITPDQVEEKLQEVLEMVMSWNAVLLLDEADIFLEARTKSDILRNSMVGVFLRMLEYHNGVLFMTTNRVNNFDPAVLSRISVILKYPDFNPEIRKQVWANILGAAGLSDMPFDYDFMAVEYEVNGRQIKNAIRIASSLASSRGVPVSQELIEGRIKRMVAVIGELENEAVDEPIDLLEKAS